MRILFIVTLLFFGCAKQEKGEDMKTWPKIQLQSDSKYMGKSGAIKFLECAGYKTLEVSDGDVLIGSSSLRDLLSLSPDFRATYGLLEVSKLEKFAQFAPRDFENAFGPNVRLSDEILAREDLWIKYMNYSDSQDTASVSTIKKGWPEQLIYFGGDPRLGIYFLLNPNIETADGEFEAILLDFRFPGAYRFESAAELIGHIFYFKTKIGRGDEYRFGRNRVKDSCAALMFNYG